MAQHRQSGIERYGVRGSHDMHQTNGAADHVAIGIRATTYTQKHQRLRRPARSDEAQFYTIGVAILVFFCLVLLVTILAYYYISKEGKEINNGNDSDETDDMRSDSDFLTNVPRIGRNRVLEFGQGSVGRGQDSRYWDADDRRRDEDYNEDVMEQTSGGSWNENVDKDDALLKMNHNMAFSNNDSHTGIGRRGAGLYNEAGRNELKRYEAEYEASLKKWGNIIEDDGRTSYVADMDNKTAAADIDDKYDDFFNFHDSQIEDYDDNRKMKGEHSNFVLKSNNEVHKASRNSVDAGIKDDIVAENVEMASSLNKKPSHDGKPNAQHISLIDEQPIRKSPLETKKKPRSRKFSGLCEMKLLNSTSQLVEPSESQKFAKFNLQYAQSEEKPLGEKEWVPRFAGHQSLEERENSFLAHDQKINCGFVRGSERFPSTGFDLAEDDASYISRCHIAVISCIFGNSDRLRKPTGKTVFGFKEEELITSLNLSLALECGRIEIKIDFRVTRLSRKNVCFVMFIDEVTLQTLTFESQVPDRMGFIGFWKLVVVKNLPYGDMRRVGKIPKLLPHRLFPSARYSIWLDSKLRLQIDPLLTLDYLWRKGYEFAISNHYDRHCIWEEVAQNKKLNKYNHTVIDQQFAFYQADGLQRFNASDPNKLLPSNVPEGSFIVREHTQMSNLFSCLWFNEVDRFTPRDQLRRMNPDMPFHLNMFKDCERRRIAKLFRHRVDEKRSSHGKTTE